MYIYPYELLNICSSVSYEIILLFLKFVHGLLYMYVLEDVISPWKRSDLSFTACSFPKYLYLMPQSHDLVRATSDNFYEMGVGQGYLMAFTGSTWLLRGLCGA